MLGKLIINELFSLETQVNVFVKIFVHVVGSECKRCSENEVGASNEHPIQLLGKLLRL